jgi:hypothetical protein
MLNGACNSSGSSSAGVCSVISSVRSTIAIVRSIVGVVVCTTTFAIVLTSVEDLLGDLSGTFQVCLSVFIMVFDLESPRMQNKDFVYLVGGALMSQFRVQPSFQFFAERCI